MSRGRQGAAQLKNQKEHLAVVKILLLASAIGTVASAVVAEPVTLADVQMDRVTAGAKVTNEPGNFRYESDHAIVAITGHEGLAEYEVTETENGVALVAVANGVSNGSEATATARGLRQLGAAIAASLSPGGF